MFLQWDDLTDGSPTPKRDGKSRLHLPSPKKRVVSPLNVYKPTKVSKRRTVKRWTLLEEDTLRTGVQKYVIVLPPLSIVNTVFEI